MADPKLDALREDAVLKAEASYQAAQALEDALAAAEEVEPPVEPPIEPPPVDSNKCTWLSGMDANRDGDPFAEFRAFAEWRGLPVRGGLCYHGSGYFGKGKTWPGMFNSPVVRKGGEIDTVLSRPEKYFISHAQPLLLADQEQKFSLLTNGSLDDEHRAIAKTIAATVGDRWDRFTLRLGWEANKGYPWSWRNAPAAELTHYAPGWARIAKIYKAESGGKVQIIWNHLKEGDPKFRDFYPGDDVVDIIGVDPYDNGFRPGRGFVKDEAAWQDFLGYYDKKTGEVIGIKGFRDFAIEHNKKITYEEWGATCQNADHSPDGSNNGFYVTKMVEWFKSLGDQLMFECYFNGPWEHKIYPVTTTQPKPSVAYKAAYTKLNY